MGFLDRINKIWSGADFWDKQENAKQRQQFAQKDEEERRRKAAEAQARAQAQATRPTPQASQQANVSVDDTPRKPSSVSVAQPNSQPSLQVYKPTNQSKVTVERPTAEQIAHNKKMQELEQFKTARLARALEQEKKQTSWFDRQFTDRGWDKRAEARAISGATKDYQDKYGWNNDRAVINYGRGASNKLDQAENTNASKWIAPVISTGRVGTGIVQGAAGLYDLATPGKGTNRLSQAATKKAEEQDQLAKDLGIDATYKVGNVVGEIGSYVVPGIVAAKVAKAVGATAKGASILGKGATKVDDLAKLIDKGGDAGRFKQFIASRMRQNFTLEEAIQEFMLTGRYMGQNTGRGDDTSPVSIATDIATGIGGALLIPTQGLNRLIDGPTNPGTVADDIAGSSIAGGADYIDNALRNADVPPATAVDAPPVRPDTPPVKPDLPEVAQGVKSPNLANPSPTPAPVTPPVQQVTPPVETPGAPQLAPPGQSTPIVAGQRVEVPQVSKPIEVPQKPVMEQPPVVQQAIPEAAPVANPIETPVVAKSKEIASTTPVAPVTPQAPIAPVKGSADEVVNSLRSKRDMLLQERDARAAEGLPTKDIDAQINALDRAIADEVSPPKTAESKALADGDKQLAEAKADVKPEISKQETPSKPKKAPKETNVKTLELSADELRARGVSEEGIARAMARQAKPEAPKVKETKKADVAQSEATPVKVKPEKPSKPEPKAKTVGKAKEADALDKARAKARAKEIEEIKAKGEAMGVSEKGIQEQIDKVSKAWSDRKPGLVKSAKESVARAEEAFAKAEAEQAIMGKGAKKLASYTKAKRELTQAKKILAQFEGIKTVKAEAELPSKPTTRSKKERALEVIEGASKRSDRVELYKDAKARGLIETSDIPKEYRKEVLADTVMTEGMLPEKARNQDLPSKPTQAQLNKGATENTIKSGKVSKKWINEQKAAGATDKQIAKAVEKIEGKKVPLTPSEQELAARRAENNKVGRENKKKAEAEGKDKQAAPNVTQARAKQRAQETASPEEIASIARRTAAYTKGVNIEEGMIKAQKKMDEVSDDGVLEHVRKLLDESSEIDDAERVFDSIAISKRLDAMQAAADDAGVKLSDDLIKLTDEITQGQALVASGGGLINRLTQEVLKNVPAPVRVQKRLDDIAKKFEELKVDFKPSEADEKELVKLTREFDSASTSMLGLEDELNANRLDYNGNTTPEQGDELFKKHKQLEADHVKAQQEAVAKSLAFNEKLKSMLPELPRKERMKQSFMRAPDHVGNYLRLAMLSAPSGRLRDVGSTAINVADQSIVDLISSTIGKGTNKILGTNVIDSYGSKASTKKGISGAWDKVKASWSGKPTLDEATGRKQTHSRAELTEKNSITSFGIDHGTRGSKWNIPKKVITTGVQVPTDTSYGLFTKRLYALGEVDARANGITDKKQIKQYAEMFMDNPTKEAALDAGDKWLGASGMQKNKLSKKLTKVADDLEAWGNKKVDSDGKKLNTAQRTARKSLAVTVRTTTIPFVQYTGGSTHAMLMRQNPVSNISQSAQAFFKSGDIQRGIDELSRFTWNSGKIAGLIGLMESNVIETSDTDADGVTTYNGPYVVRNGQYIPMGTYGIAGGSALISAHYLRRGYDKMKSGDVFGGISDIVAGPPMAIVKASGLDNMLSGTNILGGATENFEKANSNADMTPGDVAITVGAGLVGDLGSQGVPAASRDLNSGFDNGWKVGGKTIIQDTWNPTKEKPDTSGKDPLTGKVDPILKAKAQITSGIPVLSQQLPRKSGQQSRTFQGRVLNANTQSEQQKAQIAADKNEETTTVNRTADVVSDDKVANLLSEETRAIYDKYKGDMSKASQDDSNKIWREVTAAKDRLLDDGSYDSYSKILTYERDEAKAKGSSTPTEIAEMDRKITRADVAGKLKTKPQVFRLYANVDTPEGGGISQTEFKKMLQLDDDGNPEYPDLYDPETATLLWELDEAMTKAGASANTNGLDPWTRNKYNLDEALGRGKYASKGSGSKDKGVATGFGTIGAFAKAPGKQSQKYQKLTNSGAMPNLTASSSKTKLRKNISVVKGVRL